MRRAKIPDTCDLNHLEEGLQAIVVQFGRPVGKPVTELIQHVMKTDPRIDRCFTAIFISV